QAPSSAPYTSPYPPSRAAAETLNGYGEATYPFPDGHTVALSASTVRSAGEGASLRRQSAVLRDGRSEEHTSELQSRENIVCRLPPTPLQPLALPDALPISGAIVSAIYVPISAIACRRGNFEWLWRSDVSFS